MFIILAQSFLGNGQFLFSTLKPQDGLSSRETRCIFRSNDGYVWIGTTNGLNRFDGHHFKIWNKLRADYPKELGEIITGITEDESGQIWFGTNAGIGLLNTQTLRLKEIEIKATKEGRKLYIYTLQKDGAGRLWAATNKGLIVEQKGVFVPVSTIYPFARALDSTFHYQDALLYDSVRNCFWIGTSSGSFCLDLNRQQLFSAGNNPAGIPFLSKDVVNALAQDKDGTLWFSNVSRTALCSYNFTTKTYQQITHINNNPGWKLNGGCNNLFFDKQGRLWISTWLYSVFIRHPNGTFAEVPYKQNLPYSIGYGFFHGAFEDRYGNLWLATINGISRLSSNEFIADIVQVPTYTFYLTTGFANINAVRLDEEGNWWLGKMDGLFKYNKKRQTFERFIISATQLRLNEIFNMQWIRGELWCATSNGIRIFNPVTKQFRLFDKIPTKKGGELWIYWLLQDKEGSIWFSAYKEGVFRFDPKTSTTIHFNESNKHLWGLNTLNSSAAFITSDGRVWVQTTEGVSIFDPLQQKFTSPITTLSGSGAVTAIAENENKKIWLATTNRGLLRCDRQGRVEDSITRKDGLPLNYFNDMLFDSSGRMWLTSRENLLSVLPAAKKITPVTVPANFSFNDHWNNIVKKGAFVYAAMLDNVVVINTQRFQKFPQHHSPLISGFYLFDKEQPLNAGVVNLKHSQNFFSFEFASPFHKEAASIQYAYKLEGFDKDWVYCGRELTANYTNVPDGSFTFLVKTTNEMGQWMDKAAAVKITIAPPFWKTWWFIGIIAIIFALILYGIYILFQKRKDARRIDDTIDYFANSLYGENSVSEICWDIARNCITQLRFEDCVVYLKDAERNVFIQKAAYGPKNPKEHEILNPIEVQPGQGIVGSAAASGKPILISDTTKDHRYIVDDQVRLSELAVPILHDGEVIGIIDSEHTKKHFFTGAHLKAVSTIASISANKIAEAQAEAKSVEKERQLLEIKKLLAESKLMSLRAQMNPHFVFNCLNSIQECIVTEKYGEASNYLNKFSKLFRTVLNNSGKNLVSLKDEKEVLQLYLELEYMRFEQSFTYQIVVDEELDEDEILMPSMLLQPYVENALWHGLMHKEGDRQLRLHFKYISEEVYQCIIDDNGIGRRRSEEIKKEQSKAKRHQSMGMQISRDRIELLQRQEQHAKLEIIDKYDGQLLASGTTVVIELSTFLT